MNKQFEELTFADDFIFCHVLESNKDMCRRLAELLTGRKVKEIVDVEQQKSIRESRDGKGVRFDVVFHDEEDTIYDIEMQTTNKYDLPMRARYYQSLADLEALKRGE